MHSGRVDDIRYGFERLSHEATLFIGPTLSHGKHALSYQLIHPSDSPPRNSTSVARRSPGVGGRRRRSPAVSSR